MKISKTLNKLLHSKYVIYGILLMLIINILGYLRIRKNKIYEGVRTIGTRTTPIRKLTTKRDISTRDINGISYGKTTMQMKIIPDNSSEIAAINKQIEDLGSKIDSGDIDIARLGEEQDTLKKKILATKNRASPKEIVALEQKATELELSLLEKREEKNIYKKELAKLENEKPSPTKEQKIQSAKLNKGIEVTSWKWGAEPNIHYYGKNRRKKYRMAEINNNDNIIKQQLMYYVPSSNLDLDKYSTNMFLNKLSLKKQGRIFSI